MGTTGSPTCVSVTQTARILLILLLLLRLGKLATEHYARTWHVRVSLTPLGFQRKQSIDYESSPDVLSPFTCASCCV